MYLKEHSKDHPRTKRLVGRAHNRASRQSQSTAEPSVKNNTDQSKKTNGQLMKGYKTYDSIRDKVMNSPNTAEPVVSQTTKTKRKVSLAIESWTKISTSTYI